MDRVIGMTNIKSEMKKLLDNTDAYTRGKYYGYFCRKRSWFRFGSSRAVYGC